MGLFDKGSVSRLLDGSPKRSVSKNCIWRSDEVKLKTDEVFGQYRLPKVGESLGFHISSVWIYNARRLARCYWGNWFLADCIQRWAMGLRILTYQLESNRKRWEGLRIGVVRRPPRGVRREDYAQLNCYDVWFPILAPSQRLLSWKHDNDSVDPVIWRTFTKRFRVRCWTTLIAGKPWNYSPNWLNILLSQLVPL